MTRRRPRPDPCRARWRHSSPRPPRPKGRSLGCSVHLHFRSASWRYPVPPAPDRRCLSEASIPPIAFSRQLEPEDLYAQLGDRSCTGVTQKPQRCLRATGGQVPAGLRKAWPGENVDEPSSPAFLQLSSQNYRSCSFLGVPILCPIGSDSNATMSNRDVYPL